MNPNVKTVHYVPLRYLVKCPLIPVLVSDVLVWATLEFYYLILERVVLDLEQLEKVVLTCRYFGYLTLCQEIVGKGEGASYIIVVVGLNTNESPLSFVYCQANDFSEFVFLQNEPIICSISAYNPAILFP